MAKIAFVSFKTLIDGNSGASLELRTVFEGLTNIGHEVQSFSTNCYDTGDDYRLDEKIDRKLNPAIGKGNLFHYDCMGVRHYLYVGSSKDTLKLDKQDLENFTTRAKLFLQEFSPDFVVFYGSNELVDILGETKAAGRKVIFYAGTAAYEEERKPIFDISDAVVCPTGYIADLYRERFGVDPRVIPTTLPFDTHEGGQARSAAGATTGFITLFNPAPDKGGHVFFKLASRMQEENLNFLAIESRATKQFWDDRDFNTGSIENLWWAPWQTDVRKVLRKTSLLLMPSLVNEAAGKVISEAMSFGIPCIGYDTGGISEQIGSGGTVLPLPQYMRADPKTHLYDVNIKPADIEVWRNEIVQLFEPERYEALSLAALGESKRFEKTKVLSDWNTLLSDLANGDSVFKVA